MIEKHDDPCETTQPATHVRRHRGSRSPKRGESPHEHRQEDHLQAQAAAGSVKKYLGRTTGNSRLRVEGRVDQFEGNVKQAGEKVKDAFKH
ncbi:CsbD family protein [Mycobacteroides chelonae]